jgi:hypothetical protein
MNLYQYKVISQINYISIRVYLIDKFLFHKKLIDSVLCKCVRSTIYSGLLKKLTFDRLSVFFCVNKIFYFRIRFVLKK